AAPASSATIACASPRSCATMAWTNGPRPRNRRPKPSSEAIHHRGTENTETKPSSRRKAGTHASAARETEKWVPAFAGTTRLGNVFAPWENLSSLCLCGDPLLPVDLGHRAELGRAEKHLAVLDREGGGDLRAAGRPGLRQH